MPATLINPSELARIQTALLRAGELIALEALVSTVLPWNIVTLLRTLPAIVNEIQRLVAAIENVGANFVTAEGKVLANLQNQRIGIPEAFAIELAPLAQVALGSGAVWVKKQPKLDSVAPPVDTRQLVERLNALSKLKRPTIRIDSYLGSGQRRFVVYIPGTKSVLGGPMDMRSNVLELAGKRSPVERAVELALRSAGAKANDKVLVVGHSLGGMVALSLAERSSSGQVPYTVDKVVEIASPIGALAQPGQVKTLAIEGNRDLVPALDGLPDPNWRGLTEVKLDQQSLNPLENHELQGYLGSINQAEASAKFHPWLNFGRVGGSIGTARYFEIGLSGAPF